MNSSSVRRTSFRFSHPSRTLRAHNAVDDADRIVDYGDDGDDEERVFEV